MYAPLIVGFIVIVLATAFVGWLLDRSAQRDAERDRH